MSRPPAVSNETDEVGATPESTPLGLFIRETRMIQGVSQRALADRSGLSRSYLCDIERGRGAQPSIETLDRLARALGSSRAELLRAAGILDGRNLQGDDGERRLLAIYRDLPAERREMIERFARFVHAEEHRWVQPNLIEAGTADPDGDDRPVPQGGPTLFDD